MRTLLAAGILAGFSWLPASLPAQSTGRLSGPQAAATVTVPIEARPDGWRYRWHMGYWWYYTPQQTWLVYENNVWKPFIVPPPAPVLPAVVQPVVTQPQRAYTEPMFGVDSP